MNFDFKTEAGFQKFFIFLAGIIGTVLMSMFGVSPDKSNQLVTVLIAVSPVLASIAFAIFNQIAAAGKAKTEIAKIGATADAIAKTGIIPASDTSEVKPAVVVEEPKPTPVIVVAPFNEQAFMDEVNKTVTARYAVVNPSTVFYNAEQVFRDWTFGNEKAVNDGKALLLKLADAAFKSVWGTSYKEAWTYLNDPLGRGCPTCTTQKGCTYPDLKYKAQQMGTGYYTALLDYERIMLIQ